MDKRLIIGVSLGFSGIEAILCDGDFNILERQNKEYPGKVGKDSIIVRLAKTITSLADYHRAFAVGVALPATYDKESKKILSSSIEDLEGVDFFQLLSKKIDKPIFTFRRNTSLMLAEQAFGAASDYKNAVLVEIGRDISLSMLINGKIHRGNTDMEGQIGEMIVDITREKRNESGSFGSLVSGEGIETLTGKSVYEVLKNAPDSELISKQIIRDLKESLLTGLYNVKLIIDPEAFIICGDILENYKLFQPAFENLKVVVKKSELGKTAAALGAVVATYNQINKKI